MRKDPTWDLGKNHVLHDGGGQKMVVCIIRECERARRATPRRPIVIAKAWKDLPQNEIPRSRTNVDRSAPYVYTHLGNVQKRKVCLNID